MPIKTEDLFNLGAVQDRIVQPNIVIPEIDPNAPLSSGDFYSILKDDEEEEKVEEKVEAKQTDFRLLTEEEEEKFYPTPTFKKEDPKLFSINNRIVSKEKYKGYGQDKELLEAWLNTEYFGKGAANQAMGTDNITAYQINNPTLGSLIKDFKSNLGELGVNRTAFPNLSDSDLDGVFENIFNAQARAFQKAEGEKDERKKVNDIILKKEKGQSDAEAIELGVDRLDNVKITSFENKEQALFAQLVKKLKN